MGSSLSDQATAVLEMISLGYTYSIRRNRWTMRRVRGLQMMMRNQQNLVDGPPIKR
jgi:hypothetical protein